MTDPLDPRASGSDAAADRRAELLAGALADDLSPEERTELDALLVIDPDARTELAELQGLVDRSRAVLDGTRDARPSDALRARVLGIPAAEQEDLAEHDGRRRAAATGATGAGFVASQPAVAGAASGAASSATARTPGRTRASSRRRPIIALVTTAAACLALGAAVALGAQSLVGPAPTGSAIPLDVATGAPGELGAVEPIDFAGEPRGVAIDAALIAHTWGTETVLEIDGFAAGDAFDVVLIGSDGAALSSGGFLGSAVTIECRINAALLREDVAAVEIRDARGAIVATAELPAVDS